MSQYGRDSEKQAFSYMDGVPVKISEQYKPPRKVVLPVGFQHRLPIETIKEEYDFKLERSVLDKMGEWRKIRNSTLASRKERIKAEDTAWQDKLSEDVQQFSLGPSGSKQETKDTAVPGTSCVTYSHPTVSSTPSHIVAYPNSVSSPSCNVPYSNSLNPVPSSCAVHSNISMGTNPNYVYSSSSNSQPNQQYSLCDSILTPIPISHMSSELRTIKTSFQFNISDFEADTSSPFDNMELKTINEMEELAHVLQPLSNSPDSNKNESPGSGITISNNYSAPAMPFITNQTITHYNTVGSKANKDPVMLPHLNGLTGYSSYGTMPRSKDQDSRNENYVNLGSNQYEYSSNVQQKMANYSFYPEQTWNINLNLNHSQVAYRPTATGDVNSDVIGNVMSDDESSVSKRLGYSSPVTHKPLTYGLSFPSTCNQRSSPCQDQQSSSRSLSKSVPDIVQELERELTEKRIAETNVAASRTSHTPPPRPNSFGSTGLENWKPWPDLDSPEQPPSKGKRIVPLPTNKKATASSLPNPFQELSASAQELTRHISEMGFPLPRVARACQTLGEDGKKVVEFLLQLQSLEEAKWSGDLAEKALIVSNYNQTEAVKHLEAMTQLLDLGFSEENVRQALIMFNNDRDKALDRLIA